MRAYKFLNAHWGLKCLYERRLRVTRLQDLNDPFELLPFVLANQTHRVASLSTRTQLGARVGLLCFSGTWRNPVIWSHYSDRHRGICLGFDIPDKIATKIKYVKRRSPFPDKPQISDIEVMLYTKFSHWKYEKEIRVWVKLEEEEDGSYYREFGESLRLVEVITGASCTVPRIAVARALGSLANEVTLIKARAGFHRFEIVPSKRGLK